MTLIRESNHPHLFYPKTAQKYGIHVAIVEMAISELGYRGEESPPRCVSLKEILERCWYLSDLEVSQAYRTLIENNEIDEVK